jgi:hypothetical protein
MAVRTNPRDRKTERTREPQKYWRIRHGGANLSPTRAARDDGHDPADAD